MRLPKMIRILLFSNKPYRFVLLASLIILSGIFIKRSPLLKNPTRKSANFRAVITTLVRSDDRSIYLVMNMIHSVLRYHPYPNSSNQSYPFLIFHDHNFTLLMRQQILSCVLNTYPLANISFALVYFNTTVKPSRSSPQSKSIGYRLMCRFWIYDIFYHPAIVQGQYDYLMRMDDDSYFFDRVSYDLFQHMHHTDLDYIYRALYDEPTEVMNMILAQYVDDLLVRLNYCIYNNFFAIRLQWYYQTKSIQAFIHDLLKDDLILREYIGDGCVHGAMLKLNSKTNRRQIVTTAYGHNYHVLPMFQRSWKFNPTQNFVREINETCARLALISPNGTVHT